MERHSANAAAVAAFFLGARLDATVPLLHLPAAFAAEAKGPASDPENPLFRSVRQNYLKVPRMWRSGITLTWLR
jgi:isopenicillin N synthase-like dioxygenase